MPLSPDGEFHLSYHEPQNLMDNVASLFLCNIIFWKDKQGVYRGCYHLSEGQCSTSHPIAEHLLGKTDQELFSTDLAKEYQQQDINILLHNQIINSTLTIKLPGGETAVKHLNKQVLRDQKGGVLGIIGNTIDVNQLNPYERELLHTKEKLISYEAIKLIVQSYVKETVGHQPPANLSILENIHYLHDYLENIIALIPGHVYWLDKNNVYLGCNNEQAINAGLTSRKEIIGKTNHDFPWKDRAEEIDKLNTRIMESGKRQRMEEYAVTINGPTIFLSEKAPLFDANNNVIGILGASFNINNIKRAEEERLNLALQASQMSTWGWDLTDDIFTHDYLQNDTPYRFQGTLEQAITRARHSEQEQLRKAFMQSYKNNVPLDIEYQVTWFDGTTRHIAMRGKMLQNKQGKPSTRMIGVCWDVTERKHLEQTLHQQQLDLAHIARLNAMGELASTLAHELNQPLAAISNYLKGSIIRLTNQNYRPEELINVMQLASSQAERAGEIVHRMKNFIRKGKLYYETIDINAIIRETLGIVQYDPNTESVDIQLQLTEELPPLKLDKIQIGQVIINLIRNAIEAAQQAQIANPKIVIITSKTLENEIYVDVIDNGPGCPPALQTQLFTPYFTTKKTGMGMGLAICRTIVEAHNGNLSIITNNKPGAWFRFTLPIEQQKMATVIENIA